MRSEYLRTSLAAHADWQGLLSAHGETVSDWASKVNRHPTFAPLIADVRMEAERLLKSSLPSLPWSKYRLYSQEGSRLPYEELYFDRRRRLTAYGMMTLLKPEDSRYLEQLHEVIWAVCEEYSWCLPAHLPGGRSSRMTYSTRHDQWMHHHSGIWVDLFASETAFALAEILHLIGDKLPEVLQERIRFEVYRRVLYPFMNEGPFGWENARHNWSAVCAGSISAAAIYLIEDAEELAEVLEKSISSLECFLDGYLPDGACMEGFYYWGYGFGFFVYAADLIKLRTGGLVDLLQNEKVKNIAEFQHKCFLSGDQVVNFADAQRTGRLNIGLAHYLASLFPACEVPEQTLRATFSDDHCGRWAPAMRSLLWFNPDLQGKPWPEASFWLADAQWLISRYVMDRGTYAFAAKGGHNEEPHNHNDVGHFLLHINGESLLADMGWGEYTAEYFSVARYEFICTSSAGHSVPIVAGQYQQPGKDRKAKVQLIAHGDCCEIMELDITEAYEVKQLHSLVRRMEWWKGQVPRLVLIDTFQWRDEADQMDRDSGCEESTAIKERFICMSRPIAIEDGQLEIVGEQGNRLYVNYDAEQFVPEVKKLTMRDHYGKWIDYYALDFTMITNQKTSVAKFEFVLVAKHE